jgi:hypothetical protein
MKQNLGYEIKHDEAKIIVTKWFLKKAGIIGSPEYKTLADLRRDWQGYQFRQREISKKEGKQTYGKLTYKRMGEFIETKEEADAAAVLAEFERIKKLSKCQNGSYAFVKKWFLTKYADDFRQEDDTEE